MNACRVLNRSRIGYTYVGVKHPPDLGRASFGSEIFHDHRAIDIGAAAEVTAEVRSLQFELDITRQKQEKISAGNLRISSMTAFTRTIGDQFGKDDRGRPVEPKRARRQGKSVCQLTASARRRPGAGASSMSPSSV
jgi:hypothetical protein